MARLAGPPAANVVDKLWNKDGLQKIPQRNNLKLTWIGVFLRKIADALEQVHDQIDSCTHDRCHGAR